MRSFQFVTVDVFTDRPFGGNPLAVFPDAEGLSDREMQSLATEFNLSETTFVLPAADAAHTARVRIFNRSAEMAFAGHPNVGTAWVLGRLGRTTGARLCFEEIAGPVEIRIDQDRVTVDAPEAFSLGPEMPADLFAACVGLEAGDIAVSPHRPVLASVGHPFVIGEVSADALGRAIPDLAAFRKASGVYRASEPHALSLYIYAREGNALRARMFSPLAGTFEDAATGSAAMPLTALLLTLARRSDYRLEVLQGVEMGRSSRLLCTANRTGDAIRASVSGSCVQMSKGEVCLPDLAAEYGNVG